MTQQNLFEVPEVKITDTCRHCEHRQRWQCGGSVIQYCGVRKSNRTDNGLLKIKVTDKACPQFKKVTVI
jgi:hypothetical protein